MGDKEPWLYGGISVEGTDGSGAEAAAVGTCYLQGIGQVGSLPAGGCPPFSGESWTCTSFAIARAKASGSAGALEAECQPLQPPHCTLALYGLGAGPLKGFAEQQQGLSPSFAGNLHLCDQFSLRRMLSSYSLHLRGEGYSYFLSQEEGNRIKLRGILFLTNCNIYPSSMCDALTM